MDLVALAALHAAATAIVGLEGIIQCTCENDHNSGEIIFTTVVGNQFILRLEEHEDDEDYEQEDEQPVPLTK